MLTTWLAFTREAFIHGTDHLGLIPTFFDDEDPRPAVEQVRDRYIGGWNPDPKWCFSAVGNQPVLLYPGDQPLRGLLYAFLHSNDSDKAEMIAVFPYGIVCIARWLPDKQAYKFEAARLD